MTAGWEWVAWYHMVWEGDGFEQLETYMYACLTLLGVFAVGTLFGRELVAVLCYAMLGQLDLLLR